MIRRINLFAYVRRYQWILAGLLMLVVLFVMVKPEVPADLNYKYQLDLRLRSYPLVAPTAGLVQWSTERVREVYRWNLIAETVGRSAPPDKAGTPGALLPATVFIILGCLAMCLVWFVPSQRRVGFGLVVLVIAGSHLGAHPGAYVKLAAAPSTLIPNVSATLVTKADPGRTLDVEHETASGLKDMADRYFEHYVRFTEHRMGSAGKLLAGPKRVWFGISGLLYVLPFAVLLAGLAALTVLVQDLNWVLFILAPFGLAVALLDGRAGLKVWDHVILPLLITMALLFILGLVLPLVLFLATLVHAMENEVGLLLIGSLFPLVLGLLALYLYTRTRGGRRAITAHAHGTETRSTWSGPDPDRTRISPAPGRSLRSLLPRRRRPRQ